MSIVHSSAIELPGNPKLKSCFIPCISFSDFWQLAVDSWLLVVLFGKLQVDQLSLVICLYAQHYSWLGWAKQMQNWSYPRSTGLCVWGELRSNELQLRIIRADEWPWETSGPLRWVLRWERSVPSGAKGPWGLFVLWPRPSVPICRSLDLNLFHVGVCFTALSS